MDDAVVITGCGWVTSRAAGSASEVLAAVRKADALPPGHHRVPAELLDAGPPLPTDLAEEADVRLAARAVQLACADAGRSVESLVGERTALVLGCSQAGQGGMIAFANEVREQSARFVSPIHFPQTVGNYPAGAVGRAFHIRGVNLTLACGVTSGLEAIGEAARLLAEGAADVAIAGGLDVFTEPLARALGAEHPVLADSACVLILERAGKSQQRPGAAWRWGGLRRVSPGGWSSPKGATQVQAGCGVRGVPDVVELTGWSGAASGAAALAVARASADGTHVHALAPGEGGWWAVAELRA